MKKNLIIILVLTFFLLATITTFAIDDMSLVTETDDFRLSYGSARKITLDDIELVSAIEKSGKNDFKEGFLATFTRGSFYCSEQYIVIDDKKDYTTLVFDVCVATKEKFGDIENGSGMEKGTPSKFNIETVVDGEFPSWTENDLQIFIQDSNFTPKYAVTASNEWNRVEVDISKLDGLIFYFSMNNDGTVIISNPRLTFNTESSNDNDVIVTNFIDVESTAWYFQDVMEAKELGIINGKGNGIFDPNGNLTIAEAVTIVAKVRSMNDNDNIPSLKEGNWYDGAVQYAINKGIMPEKRFMDYTAKITREEMAYIFAHALPPEYYNPIKSQISIPDVLDNEDNEEIYTLYQAGILAGSDSQGTFNPTTNITRAEAAAIINRLVNNENRLK